MLRISGCIHAGILVAAQTTRVPQEKRPAEVLERQEIQSFTAEDAKPPRKINSLAAEDAKSRRKMNSLTAKAAKGDCSSETRFSMGVVLVSLFH
jgi:hypothetical protein